MENIFKAGLKGLTRLINKPIIARSSSYQKSLAVIKSNVNHFSRHFGGGVDLKPQQSVGWKSIA